MKRGWIGLFIFEAACARWVKLETTSSNEAKSIVLSYEKVGALKVGTVQTKVLYVLHLQNPCLSVQCGTDTRNIWSVLQISGDPPRIAPRQSRRLDDMFCTKATASEFLERMFLIISPLILCHHKGIPTPRRPPTFCCNGSQVERIWGVFPRDYLSVSSRYFPR